MEHGRVGVTPAPPSEPPRGIAPPHPSSPPPDARQTPWGWLCPRCFASNAPVMKICPCGDGRLAPARLGSESRPAELRRAVIESDAAKLVRRIAVYYLDGGSG